MKGIQRPNFRALRSLERLSDTLVPTGALHQRSWMPGSREGSAGVIHRYLVPDDITQAILAGTESGHYNFSLNDNLVQQQAERFANLVGTTSTSPIQNPFQSRLHIPHEIAGQTLEIVRALKSALVPTIKVLNIPSAIIEGALTAYSYMSLLPTGSGSPIVNPNEPVTASIPPVMNASALPAERSNYGGGTFSMRLEMSMRQVLQLTLQPMFRQPSSDYYEEIYNNARKLYFDRFGLQVEAAVIGRLDMPELTRLGSPGLMAHGYGFVVEDFLPDLDPKMQEIFMILIAVHEYGEKIFQNHPAGAHHMATRLEFAVADRIGVFEEYLSFLEKNSFVKFRDVVLHRLAPVLFEKLKEAGVEVTPPKEESDERTFPVTSAQNALAMAEDFEIPDHVLRRYEGIDREDMEAIEEKLDDWVSYVTVLEQVRSFHARAVDDVVQTAQVLILTSDWGPDSDDPKLARDLSLGVRLSLFKVLGGLYYDLDHNLEPELLEGDLRRRLNEDFLERLREAPIDDPILNMSVEEMEALARADYSIWKNAGLNLQLVMSELSVPEDEEAQAEFLVKLNKMLAEQNEIDALRWMGWSAAMEVFPDPVKQAEVLAGFAKVVEEFGGFRHEIESRLDNLMSEKDVWGNYLDVEDLRLDLQNCISESVISRLREQKAAGGVKLLLLGPMIQTFVDSRLPQIWEARSAQAGFFSAFDAKHPQIKFDVDEVISLLGQKKEETKSTEVKRLAYLNRRYEQADPDIRQTILDIIKELSTRLLLFGPSHFKDDIRRLEKLFLDGDISEDLAVDLIKVMLNEMKTEHLYQLPTIDYDFIPFLFEVEGMNEAEMVEIYRKLNFEKIKALTGHSPRLLMRALAEGGPVLKKKGIHTKNVSGLMNLMSDYRDALPEAFLEMMQRVSPQDLWDQMNLWSTAEWGLQQLEEGSQPLGPDFEGKFKDIYRHIYKAVMRYRTEIVAAKSESQTKFLGDTDLESLESLRNIDASSMSQYPELRRVRATAIINMLKVFANLGDFEKLEDIAVANMFVNIFSKRLANAIINWLAKELNLERDEAEWDFPLNISLNSLMKIWTKVHAHPRFESFGKFIGQIQGLISLYSRNISQLVSSLPYRYFEIPAGFLEEWFELRSQLDVIADGLPGIPEVGVAANIIKNVIKSDGFDFHGTMTRTERMQAEDRALLELEEYGTRGWYADISDELHRHFKKIAEYYFSLPDLRPEEIGEQLRVFFGNIIHFYVGIVTLRPDEYWGYDRFGDIARGVLTLLIIRERQLGRIFQTREDILSFFRTSLPYRGEGMVLEIYNNIYDLVLDGNAAPYFNFVHSAYLLSLDEGYDLLGGMNREERLALVGEIKRAKSRVRVGPLNTLKDHWWSVLSSLDINPCLGKAWEAAGDVLRDIETFYNGLPKSKRKYFDSLREVAMRTWAVLALKNGEEFGSVEQLYKRTVKEFPTMGDIPRFRFEDKVFEGREGVAIRKLLSGK